MRLGLCQPQKRLDTAQQQLAAKRAALEQHVFRHMRDAQKKLDQRMRELDMLSPYRVLSRGYAIVTRNGQPVSSAARLAAGDRIAIRFADGVVGARIDERDQQEG